jgi:hypothetical protein
MPEKVLQTSHLDRSLCLLPPALEPSSGTIKRNLCWAGRSWFCYVPGGQGCGLSRPLVGPQFLAHIHCPVAYLGMQVAFTVFHYFLFVDLFVICLPARLQVPRRGEPLSCLFTSQGPAGLLARGRYSMHTWQMN